MQLGQAYDLIGDTENAIRETEIALVSDTHSTYINCTVLHMLCYRQLAQLHYKHGNIMDSIKAAFQCIALTEEYIEASQEKIEFPTLNGEQLPENYEIRSKKTMESIRDASPSDYARGLFQELIEPIIQKEINGQYYMEEPLKFFIQMVEMAKQLPVSVSASIEALANLYLGLFYASRGYLSECHIAFDRTNDLVTEHDLKHVKLTYLLHKTFDFPQLYSSEYDFLMDCVHTALVIISYLPESEYLLNDYSRRVVTRLSMTDVVAEIFGESITIWYEKLSKPEDRFYHVCAVFLLILLNNAIWPEDTDCLLAHVLKKPLNLIDSELIFRLYDYLGKSKRSHAQTAIMNGRISETEKAADMLQETISYGIQQYQKRFSSEQIAKMKEHLSIAKLWGSNTFRETS
jgi:hypothetical protein